MEDIEYSSYSEIYSATELDEEVDGNTSSADEDEDGEDRSGKSRHRKSAVFPHACHQDSLETLSLKSSNSIDINNTYLS